MLGEFFMCHVETLVPNKMETVHPCRLSVTCCQCHIVGAAPTWGMPRRREIKKASDIDVIGQCGDVLHQALLLATPSNVTCDEAITATKVRCRYFSKIILVYNGLHWWTNQTVSLLGCCHFNTQRLP